ncbi:hypothetical protein [Nocardioides sp. SYSU D00038]|uniref:hypothetical protein n=1 Tax=Nocardioides sp. SYSU D00038 TaxID=2812554 RepID=UPI0019677046|nr:hypothetical protein [Nocardioides sp. SYSU D00038]
MSLTALTVAAAEEHHEVNDALSWGIGAITLVILLGLLLGLIAFGGGREHS